MLEKAGRDYARAVASKDDAAKKQFACDEAIAVAESIHALRASRASEARRALEEYHNFIEGKPNTIHSSHARTPLNAFSSDCWVCSVADPFLQR